MRDEFLWIGPVVSGELSVHQPPSEPARLHNRAPDKGSPRLYTAPRPEQIPG